MTISTVDNPDENEVAESGGGIFSALQGQLWQTGIFKLAL